MLEQNLQANSRIDALTASLDALSKETFAKLAETENIASEACGKMLMVL